MENKSTIYQFGYALGELTAIVENILPGIEGTESLRGFGKFQTVVADQPSKIDPWLVELVRMEVEDYVKGIKQSDVIETIQKYYDLRDKIDVRTYSTSKDQGFWFGYNHQKARGTVLLTRQRIGQRVKELREENGLTQRALAEMADIGYSHLCRIEKGEYNVSIDILSKLSTALGAEIGIQ